MKKYVILMIALSLLLIGCAEKKETATPTPSETPVPSGTPVSTPSPSGTPTETPVSTPSQPGINTLLDLYNSKKMLHGTATVTVNGKEEKMEFWYYYDMKNNEQVVRAEGSQGVMIMKDRYEGNTLTQIMYTKGAEGMPQQQGCDWIEIKTTTTVTPSESEEVKDEPVSDAFKATFTQGNVKETYQIEFVPVDLSLFEPDGKVCTIGTFMPQG